MKLSKVKSTLTVLFAVSLTFTATAQTSDTTRSIHVQELLSFSQDSLDEQIQFQGKDPRKAKKIALLHTFAPIGIGTLISYASWYNGNSTIQKIGASFMLYGAMIGPSTGNLYAKDYKRAFAGMGFRLGVVFMPFLVLDDHKIGNYQESPTNRILLTLASISFWYNIWTAKKSARIYNRKKRIELNPSFNPRTKTPSLAVRINF